MSVMADRENTQVKTSGPTGFDIVQVCTAAVTYFGISLVFVQIVPSSISSTIHQDEYKRICEHCCTINQPMATIRDGVFTCMSSTCSFPCTVLTNESNKTQHWALEIQLTSVHFTQRTGKVSFHPQYSTQTNCCPKQTSAENKAQLPRSALFSNRFSPVIVKWSQLEDSSSNNELAHYS